MTTRDIEAATDEIERRLRSELPVLARIYVEAGRDDFARRTARHAPVEVKS
jgi:hypothetical protein